MTYRDRLKRCLKFQDVIA